MKPRFALTLLLALLLATVAADARPTDQMAIDPIHGYWRTEDGTGIVEMYSCGDQICGRLHWLKIDDPKNVSRDKANPDPDHRGRPLCGLQFMGGFIPTRGGRYEGGWIYSPASGSTYSALMTLMDANTLDLHGYVLTPLLGESQIWHRASAEPFCVTGSL